MEIKYEMEHILRFSLEVLLLAEFCLLNWNMLSYHSCGTAPRISSRYFRVDWHCVERILKRWQILNFVILGSCLLTQRLLFKLHTIAVQSLRLQKASVKLLKAWSFVKFEVTLRAPSSQIMEENFLSKVRSFFTLKSFIVEFKHSSVLIKSSQNLHVSSPRYLLWRGEDLQSSCELSSLSVYAALILIFWCWLRQAI